ncbi:family 43 glycosylhydrolase [Mucilaginibacter litoreus]|uniref:Family 43 glycosylhydrolase n=1 Tax=Mucilaginibacter litoreus TaxID=1048221 RepID=A0ABW3AQ15_9SPHI
MRFFQTFRLSWLYIALSILLNSYIEASGQIINFDKTGRQISRITQAGEAIDAHDGEIAHFDGAYYLYGTSYDCGFEWGNQGAPFCGFKVYSSEDLVTWTDRGFLFDAQTALWQDRCDGKTYGCFRPHVVFNKQNNNYVLWINVYDNIIGYRVFTSKSPVGPFTEVAEPNLAVNNDKPAKGLNNGDHDLFIDDDGQGYIAYTDWRTKGTIVIERLSTDYLTGTGECVKMVTPGSTEAPGLFKRKGRYYLTYSDPNCGYCSGTGTSYRTAPTPLGPWSEGISISDNSCGGQPSFVSTIKINADEVFLYGSDLWNNAAKNEALANYYWAPLMFNPDGSIKPLQCAEVYQKTRVLNHPTPGLKPDLAENTPFISKRKVDKDAQIAQTFIPDRNGTLKELMLTVFQNNRPDKPLEIIIYKLNNGNIHSSTPLFMKSVSPSNIGWSPKKLIINPLIKVEKRNQYAIVLKTASATGYYGFLASSAKNSAFEGAMKGNNRGQGFIEPTDEVLYLRTTIKK